MSREKYQIKEKANFLNLLLLKDDLIHFHRLLDRPTKNTDDWLHKLRNTRQVFLILDNVREAALKINLKGTKTYTEHTRQIRKTLSFVNHFRNKAIGHLDHTLLERAVQWHPSLFSTDHKDDEEFRIIEGHRAVIESSINSFIDEGGKQKIFETEIDLMYPPDHDLFYQYLWKVVTDSIEWLSNSLAILSAEIKYHTRDEMGEIAAIAGQTEFNLKLKSDLTYNEAETKKAFDNSIEKMKSLGVKKEIVELLENIKNKTCI